MIYTQFQFPQVARWQSRLSRVPRWAWIAFFISALIPLLFIFALALAAGLLVLAAVLVVSAIIGLVYRLLHRRPRSHSRGEIVVHAVRVVDP